MSKVLLFTGAGASAPLGLPTTADFNHEIETGQLEVTEKTKQYLGQHSSDIERLLSSLEEFGKTSTLTGHILSKLPNLQFHNTTYNTHQNISSTTIQESINQHITQLQNQTKKEIKRIRSIVYKKLQDYKRQESFDLYTNLLTEVKSAIPGCSISYITTNYDLTFDYALARDDFYEITTLKDSDYGFIEKRKGQLTYNQSTDYNWPSDTIEYIKIHGSLDWHPSAINNSTVKSGSSVPPANPDDMVILYPGFKGIPEKEPFISLHNKLEERLSSADIIIIIGFAFRDPYINTIFENSIKNQKNKQYILFNPVPENEEPEDSKIATFKKYINFTHIRSGISTSPNPLNLHEILKKNKSAKTPSPDKKLELEKTK